MGKQSEDLEFVIDLLVNPGEIYGFVPRAHL